MLFIWADSLTTIKDILSLHCTLPKCSRQCVPHIDSCKESFFTLDIYGVLTTSTRHKPESKYHEADHRVGSLNLSILATDVTQQGVRGFCVVPVYARNSSQGSASTHIYAGIIINMNTFSMGCRCYNYGGKNS